MIKLTVNGTSVDLEVQGNIIDELIESFVGVNALLDQIYNQTKQYNLLPLYYLYCEQIIKTMSNPSIDNKIMIDLSQLINNQGDETFE